MKTHVRHAPMAVFKGYRSHYGAGLGNILSGLMRQAVPILAPAVKNVGRTLVNVGANRLQNLIQNKLGGQTSPPPQASRRRRKQRKPVKRTAVRRKRPVKRKGRTRADIFSQ